MRRGRGLISPQENIGLIKRSGVDSVLWMVVSVSVWIGYLENVLFLSPRACVIVFAHFVITFCLLDGKVG